MLKTFKVDDVFGPSNSVPESYAVRSNVDSAFTDNLTSSSPILIYGPTATGKTTLRKKYLPDDKCKEIYCESKMSCEDLYGHILQAFGVAETEFIREDRKIALTARISGVFAGGEGRRTSGTNITKTPARPATLSAQYVSNRLRQEGAPIQPIVFEDFHTLSVEAVSEFAQAIKIFFQLGIKVICIAAWREDNLFRHAHLGQRAIEIDVGEWTEENLKAVIANGEQKLNVVFTDAFKSACASLSHGSVALLQNVCKDQLKTIEQVDSTCWIKRTNCGTAETATALIRNRLRLRTDGHYDNLRTLAWGYKRDADFRYASIVESLIASDPMILRDGVHAEALFQLAKKQRSQRGLPNIEDDKLKDALVQLNKLQEDKLSGALYFEVRREDVRCVDRDFLAWLATQSAVEIMQRTKAWYQ